jgi:hypothetical protein
MGLFKEHGLAMDDLEEVTAELKVILYLNFK